jgi:3-phenylpropionate/cinnamic acid dioxygenase small subunit
LNVEQLLGVQQFLYREARLLDERRFDEWFELFTDDCVYWMPTRYNRLREGADEAWEVEQELEDETGLAYFEDTKASLARRIERLGTGMAWAEDPPSRTRHFISNVEAKPGDGDIDIVAHSAFLVYRSRNEGLGEDEDFFAGAREDWLRVDGDTYRIAKRKIVPDFVVVNAQNLSIFF